MNLMLIVEQLKSCNFECEAGKLENNVAFQELKSASEEFFILRNMLDSLNELAKLDQQAIYKLINYRVECNQELVEHPHCQVGLNPETGRYEVGLLGILNVIARENGQAFIAVTKKDDGSVQFIENK